MFRKLTTIGSDNDLSPRRRQAVIWTNPGILLIGPLGTNFSELLIATHILSFKKMKMLSEKMAAILSRSHCVLKVTYEIYMHFSYNMTIGKCMPKASEYPCVTGLFALDICRRWIWRCWGSRRHHDTIRECSGHRWLTLMINWLRLAKSVRHNTDWPLHIKQSLRGSSYTDPQK